MRTLMICILALLAGPALSPSLHAAGSDSPVPAGPPPDPEYEAGKKAIDSRNWQTALDSFNRVAAREPGNANVQNYLGYAWRRSGNLDLAFKHYSEALRLDPSHKGAHEYIGEAYLMVNNLPKAEEHLARLDKICFFSCGEFHDLRKAIADYKSANGAGKSRP